MTRKLAIEAIGAFFLVLTIGMVVMDPGAGPFGPLAIGTTLMVMVYAGGHISGGHYNPAVTLAVFLRRRATVHELLGYWVFQIVAAAVSASFVVWMKGGPPLTMMSIDVPKVLAAEFFYTFALAFVMLNVATARGVEGNSYYGLAIGFTVMAGAYAVGPISGGSFNPAVTVATLVFGAVALEDAWAFLIPELLGGALAALVFNGLDLGNDKPTTATAAEQARLVEQGEPER